MLEVRKVKDRNTCNACKCNRPEGVYFYEVQIGGVVGCVCCGCLTQLTKMLNWQFEFDEQLRGADYGFSRKD